MCLKLTLLYNSSVDVSFDVCVQDAWLIVTFQVAPSRHLFLGKILSPNVKSRGGLFIRQRSAADLSGAP